MKKINFSLFILSFLLILISCKEGKYHDMLVKAKASNIQQDSLMLNIQFRISQDSFFQHCQVLNQEKKIYDSNANKLRVARKFNWKGQNFQMNFYPTYISDQLHRLEFEIFDEAFARWNEKSKSKLFIEVIKDYFENEFNIEMEDFDHEKFGRAYVNFTGNRRLRIYLKNEKLVGGEFLDMTEEFKK